MPLQYIEKEVRDEVDFFFEVEFPTGQFQYFRHQSFLTGDTVIIDGHDDQAFSKYSK